MDKSLKSIRERAFIEINFIGSLVIFLLEILECKNGNLKTLQWLEEDLMHQKDEC